MHSITAALLELQDVALLLLRIWLALLFGTSGWSHLRKPAERGESIGMSPASTAVLGAVEFGASVLLVIGFLDPLAAAALIGVMLGAIFKKAFVWKSGLWGDDGMGWYYEVLYVIGLLVIMTTGGGSIGL